MRNRFYVSLFFISLNFAQEPAFTYPTDNIEFEVGQTYEIKWSIVESKFQNKDVLLMIWDHPSSYSAFADVYYITSDGSLVKGNCCDDTQMKESYSIGEFSGSGSFEWTVPYDIIGKFETERPLLSIAFMDYSQSSGSQREGYIYPASGGKRLTIGFVDTNSPILTSVSSTANNGTYGIGSVIPITLNFNEPVIVTGTPQLELNVRPAIFPSIDYSSGSGSTILTFNYTVTEGDLSPDLEYPSTTALKLNGGTIKDGAGNAATLTLASPGATNSLGANKNIVIDGIVPTIVSVSSAVDNGTYGNGDVVNIAVTFSEPVTVAGTSQLTLETGTADAAVDYSYGTGTKVLHFYYTVTSTHATNDLDYASTSALALYTGTIKDEAGNSATLTLPAAGTTGSLSTNKDIVIDGSLTIQRQSPTWGSLTSGIAGAGSAGAQNLSAVHFVNSNTGWVVGQSGKILKTTDGGLNWTDQTSSATNNSGGAPSNLNDIFFINSSTGYTVGQNNKIIRTTDGGSSWNLYTYSGGYLEIFDVFFINSSKGWIVGNDGNIGYTNDGGNNWSSQTSGTTARLQSVYFINENVGWVVGNLGTILKTTDGGSTWTSQSSGTSDAIYDTYFLDSNIGWAVKANFSSSTNNTVLKTTDGGSTWSKIATIANNTQNSVHFIDSNNGWVSTDDNKILWTTDGGSTWSSHGFAHGFDINDIQIINSNIGYAVADNGWIYKLSDTTGPTVSSVSSTADNGTYGIGSVIPITVTFDESVTVTGTPQLTLETGDTDAVVNYSSGSGSSILTFNYTVASGHTSGDLDYGSTSALGLNSGTIKDAVGNAAILTLASPGAANSLGDNKAIVIDGIKPVISSTSPSENSRVNHTKVSYTLSEAASSGTVTWTRTGGSADSNSPHAKALAGDELNTGAHTDITLTNNPTLVEGAIYTISFDAKDLGENAATTISNTAITYDASAPTISSILPAANSYVNHARVSYTLSEAISSGTVTWTRTGGSEDTNSPYAKALAGDELNTGAHTDITLTNSPTLIDGAIYTVSFGATDLAGNSATKVSTTGITYDVTAPTISATTPSQNSYINNAKVSYTLSEAVASGTITWTRTGGSEDSNSPHAKALAGIELNSGAHTDITLTNSPTLVDAMYTVSFDAIDVAGNAATTVSASNVTYDFTAPTLLKVTPAADSFLPIADNSKIRIDFSEPITAYNIDASSKFGTNLNTSIQQASDSLVISVNAPLTSLDTLTFIVTNMTDRAGSVGDAIQFFYQTSILADYNNDYKVDVQDLANFVSLWPNLDLGPAKGTIPYLTPEIDGQTNLRDIGVFTRMWHWSHANNGASSKVFLAIGEPISIDFLSDKISISIPDYAIAGEIIFEYLKSNIDLGLSDEITESRLVISNQDQEEGKFSVSFGYLKDIQNKELEFSFKNKSISSANFTVSYIYYNKNNALVNSGSQDFDIKAIPNEYALHENYPNPFNPSTTLRFDLPNVSNATLSIYNMLGQKVKTFNMQNTPAGFHSLIWNATNDYGTPVGAGIYLYQLQTKDFVKTRKMVLLK
tara:strand:+ start:2349 stop:6983 length:4635 start_codon:yes stop_codon:yes gene_type:complete